MLANSIIAPQTTAAPNVQFNAGEGDSVLFLVSGVALTAVDAVTFGVISTTGTTVPVYNAAGAVVALSPTLQSVLLQGGFTYVLNKSVTAAISGVDYILKPRQGPQ